MNYSCLRNFSILFWRKCEPSSSILRIKKLHSVYLSRNSFATGQGCIGSAKEIKVPIPYGYLAAKAWGPETGTPILAFHGWQDNAGTFDKLIPLLPQNLRIIAIDAPGHGLSSHRPPGCFYSYMDMIIDFKRVADFLAWDKFSIIGHSMGGCLAQLYAMLFPEAIEKIIMIDIYAVSTCRCDQIPDITKKSLDEQFKIEKKCSGSPPIYTIENAEKRLIQGMFNEITAESAKVLVKRGTRTSESGDGVIFTRDLRLRTAEYYQIMSHETLKAFITRLKCEMLLIMSKNTHPYYQTHTPEVIPEFLDLYKKYCKKFEHVEVEGNHFVHLNNPERIAPYINQFFCSNKR